jgi:zinc transport system substrate-binding protein
MNDTLSVKGLVAVAGLAVGLGAGPALADINVAATIKPVHSLVAAVMGDTGEPALMLDGPASPHVTALRPSQARIVEKSDVVFAVGEGLEAFLHKLMENDGGARIVELADAPGVELLDYRETSDHEDDRDDQDEHDDDAAQDDGYEHGNTDPHIWLDPDNAKAMVGHIAAVLGAADPSNAESYNRNAQEVSRDLDRLERELAARLAPVKDRPFLVFHDAYQYLEANFGLNGLGAIVLNPETPPGARRLQEIRHRIGEADVACVFSEPQFEIGYVTTVLEDAGARTASLDPLGVNIDPGPDAYRQMMTQLTDILADCLAAR